MSRVAALLAAALLLGGVAGCGGDGAEPGAPSGATLVLDFTPNAVHAGIYAAQRRGFYRDEGVDLTVRQPGDSTDAPKLLEAGRAEFAILDIHDLGIAAERGLEVVGAMPLVQRPLASVIARGDGPVRRPRGLQGHTVGVTGLPSDDAVVDSEVSADGGDPGKVKRVTIGFNAVSSLAAGRIDAATAFWNAEGVALRRRGIPIRIFKVDRYGAPPYPELILTTSRRTLEQDPELVDAMVAATTRGYAFAVDHPSQALNDLLASVPSLNQADQQAQLNALLPILRPAPFSYPALRSWASWDVSHGLLQRQPAVESLFHSPAG
jgi:NitT/TauT family transport system substrate-binding protein/putative hydroxymethylpyrimidine transport system substrate-binding protein